MSLTGNGPTQVPTDTIRKAHGVLLCQRFLQARPLSHLVPTYQGTKLKASSEQIITATQSHSFIHSFIHSALDDRPFCSHPSLHSEPVNNTLLVTSFFLTHTIYCECCCHRIKNHATLILSNNEDPGRVGAVRCVVFTSLAARPPLCSRQVAN
ncbi:unnamed protein product [Fusarium graminearum]|uniref:Uncharacterized protein n=1 Tax=Gibberella zeae TaxID=5518 RepID=A0A4E9DP05_GIBZA|nr:unnamed protein product [Fusarium graminearum]CAF3598761.1 unnamed protein product [Fusarium graminearum]CAG1975358.1 unnamed protein product [Fusarium graminearum]CAG2013282.1 unnamed protein product [Fusarium graminearum]